MMQFVLGEMIFETVIAHNRVNEFQKRGLPYAHCIFFLGKVSKDKLNDPEVVDRLTGVEIPSESDSALQEGIFKHSIHNPCGALNPSAVCLVRSDREGGQLFCSEHFPNLCEAEIISSEAS